MRRSGAWMTIWDDRILEIARDEDSVSPKMLDDTGLIRVTKQQISRRLRKLADRGLLLDLGNGVYVITERGEGYLNGEISTYEDEQDEPIDVNGENGNNGTASTSGPENAG